MNMQEARRNAVTPFLPRPQMRPPPATSAYQSRHPESRKHVSPPPADPPGDPQQRREVRVPPAVAQCPLAAVAAVPADDHGEVVGLVADAVLVALRNVAALHPVVDALRRVDDAGGIESVAATGGGQREEVLDRRRFQDG